LSVTLRASDDRAGEHGLASWLRVPIVKWLAMPAALRWSAPISLMAALWWSSSRAPQRQPFVAVWAILHNAMHVVAWCLLAAMLWCALRGIRDRARRRDASWAWLLATMYGGVDEIHQSFSGRTSSMADMFSDACGALLGVMLMMAVADRRSLPLRGWLAVATASCGSVALATLGPW